jgi:hypothetical protein
MGRGTTSRCAEGDGDRVGHIGRPGDFIQPALGLNRTLHLEFGGMAVAGNSLLDFSRPDLNNFSTVPPGCEKDYAARMTHFDRRRRMRIVRVQPFYRDKPGIVLVKNLAQVIEQLNEPVGQT